MPTIYAKYRALVRSIVERRPDVAILIDFPDVNFRLAKHLKRLGIPVVYFASPQLWAWKKHRIQWVRERVTKMLVIFPFEEAYYRERGVDAAFVGHPLADVPAPTITRAEFANLYSLDSNKQWIGLLPGSRRKELRLNLPTLAAAAAQLNSQLGAQYEFLLPAASTLNAEWIRRQVEASAYPGIHIVPDARAVLHHARASVVASGTATVEAALIGNPFVVVYRLSALSYAVASRLVKLPHVAMVNLIANQRIVPELIQDEFTTENVLQALEPLLNDTEKRETMQQQLRAVGTALCIPALPNQAQRTAIDRAADQILKCLPNAR